jgi:1-hydroxy-2-isopentenylcarotenoid 3,4-desaturase
VVDAHKEIPMGNKSAVIVGAGISGLALGAELARQGMRVRIVEKNSEPGGRARVWRSEGYSFDMGPTWYLMPEVFDDFFARFGRKREDLYSLTPLDPSYRVFFGGGERLDVVPELDRNLATFERLETGGARALTRYLADAKYKYEIALKDFLYREYTTLRQLFNRRMITEGLRLNVFQDLDRYTRRFFHDRRARQLLEYHMVFLGNSPVNAPALYSLMSHADLGIGVSYPVARDGGTGGMGAVVRSLVDLTRELGVELTLGAEVERIDVRGGAARGVLLRGGGDIGADRVIVSADYHHAETALLDPAHATYGRSYWKRRAIAPSMFLLYLGLDRRLAGLAHHTLYFAEDWNRHFAAITDSPAWPEAPCFYLCAPARTDPTVAPPGGESLMVLVPVAPGLPDSPEIRATYRDAVLDHVEDVTGERIRPAIRVERTYTLSDFSADYNAYKGTALGLAHTLLQTAVFRPAHRSRRVADLWYTGAYTHPGIGVPMAIISARVVADSIAREDGD